MNLKQYSIQKAWIYEAVVASYDKSGKPNAAPMGFHSKDMETIIIRPYKDTRTLENILKWKTFTLNFIEDPSDFYEFVFEQGEEEYREIDIEAPALKKAVSYWKMNVLRVDKGYERYEITAEITDAVGKPALITRAPWLALECIINASKVGTDAKKDELRIEQIKDYKETIGRIAPNSQYENIAYKCLKRTSVKD